MKKNNIAAGMILYCPNLSRLTKNIEAIYPQVDWIFLVDNHSVNKEKIVKIIKKYKNLTLISNKENVGVAKGLNQLMQAAKLRGYDWVLTLDDDSVCDSNMIQEYSRYLSNHRIGIICPKEVDDKMETSESSDGKMAEWVTSCITAGALTKVEVWEKVGKFDEKMFIDYVDIEYCMRLCKKKYKILKVYTTKIHQQFGNIRGSIRLFGKKFYLFHYSSIRVYYSVRNQIYYLKKHRKNLSIGKQMLFLMGYIAKRLVFEKNRMQSLKSVCKGVYDGIRM